MSVDTQTPSIFSIRKRKSRALIDDLLGQVWSLLEEARIRRFRREFESAAACLV
jgi:hypothetical protein